MRAMARWRSMAISGGLAQRGEELLRRSTLAVLEGHAGPRHVQLHGRQRRIVCFDVYQHGAVAWAHGEYAATFGPLGFGHIGRIRLVLIHRQLYGQWEALDNDHVPEVAVLAAIEAHCIVAREERLQLVEVRQRRQGGIGGTSDAPTGRTT